VRHANCTIVDQSSRLSETDISVSKERGTAMKLFATVVACAIACFGFAPMSRGEVEGAPDDMAAINAILADNVGALNKHDPMVASRQYMADAEFTNVAGIHVIGAAEIEKFLAAGFATRLKAATWRPVNTTVRFITPDVAIVHVTSEISGFLNPDGSTAPPHNELSIRVFQRDGEMWRVAAFHNTTVAAAPPRRD
jgi:uncharacterized protein (TIGR02246 family)